MCNGLGFAASMTDYCGKILTIQMITNQDIGKNQKYIMVEPELHWGFNDDMIDDLADSDKPKMVSLDEVCKWLRNTLYIHTEEIEDKHWGRIDTTDWVTCDYDSVDEFIKAFRKTMEG